MLEIPESYCIGKQLEKELKGKRVVKVEAGHTPHKFAWYYGEPEVYDAQLKNRKIGKVLPYAGLIEVQIDNYRLLFQDGINLKIWNAGEKLPQKHQLFVLFDDDRVLTASVQMYGGLMVFEEGTYDNPYYLVAKEKPSPLSSKFNKAYFETLFTDNGYEKLSAKAFLATKQRIPGLGNGVLQDILWQAEIHPKTKMGTLSPKHKEKLYDAVKNTLKDMAEKGGRDTEKDLYGFYGTYETVLSKKTVGSPCPRCGKTIEKATYLGGSIYFCNGCQY